MSDAQRHDEIQGQIVHEYDGIEEADNHLPNWWLATFYGTILFGVGYWFYYHEFEVEPTTSEAYAEVAASAATVDLAEERDLLALVDDDAAIASGRETFATTCAACHGDRGQGVIGPNLTDGHWLHGGDPVSIYRSIRNGITAEQARIEGSAGMPGWGGQLGEDRVRASTAFLLSIRDTFVEGGREAEGVPYVPSDADPNVSAEGGEPGDALEPDEPGEDPEATTGGGEAAPGDPAEDGPGEGEATPPD